MAGKAVTYEGTTDRSVHDAGAVEIDGITLEKGELVRGLSDEQVERLDALPYHRFTVEDFADDELLKLSRADLDDRAREAGVPDPESYQNKQQVADAIRARDGGDS